MYGTVFTQHAMHSSEHLDYVTQTLAPDEALVATSESSFASCVAGCSWTTGTSSGAHRQEVEAFGHCARAQVRLGCSGQVPPPVRHQCVWVRPTNSGREIRSISARRCRWVVHAHRQTSSLPRWGHGAARRPVLGGRHQLLLVTTIASVDASAAPARAARRPGAPAPPGCSHSHRHRTSRLAD